MDGRLLRACDSVHRALGPGCSESVYHSALEVELREMHVRYSSQQVIPIVYKGVPVGHVRADIVTLDEPRTVLELKAVCHPPNAMERAQARRYAELLGQNLSAYVVNFGASELQVSEARGSAADYAASVSS